MATFNARRLNIWINGDVHKALRQRALDDDTTATAVVETALRAYLGLPALAPRPEPEPEFETDEHRARRLAGE